MAGGEAGDTRGVNGAGIGIGIRIGIGIGIGIGIDTSTNVVPAKAGT